jgi:fucose 4-O-acetylase-like acetyltransferase
MKALGIYFVAVGHFFPPDYFYVFTFNVPVFFVVAGFLCKKEADAGTFWRKLWYNLILPMLIISVVNFAYNCSIALRIGTFTMASVPRFVVNVLTGMHDGVKECWFIYTLMLIKIAYQYSRRGVFFGLAVLLLAVAWVYNNYDFGYPEFRTSFSNSIANSALSLPFFALGVALQGHRSALTHLGGKLQLGLLFVVAIVVMVVAAQLNGDCVWMCVCTYGNSMVWFLVGAVAGTVGVYALSRLLGRAPSFVVIISCGTILILGFHIHFIDLLRKFTSESYADYALAALVVLLFVPIIVLAKRYFPLILGKYRLK